MLGRKTSSPKTRNMGEVSTKKVLLLIQLGLVLCLIKTSVTIHITWTSLLCVMSLALTFFMFWNKRPNLTRIKQTHETTGLKNPFRGKIGLAYLSAERESQVAEAVAELVLYDAQNVDSVRNFHVIKCSTECTFAKRSRIWGSPSYDDSLSLEENTRRLIPTFYKFTMTFQELGLDAYVMELPGKLYGQNIQIFGNAVRRVLMTLCQADVSRKIQALRRNVQKFDAGTLESHQKLLVIDTSMWGRKSWVFQFNKISFFITSFAPFYPETHSRFAFGCENCYLLFQPEISFAVHDLPPDTAETNWLQPTTVRDKIRVAFRNAGRMYEAPMVRGLPMVYEIVKTVHPDDGNLLWWLPQNSEPQA